MHERGSTHVWLQSTLQSRVGEKSVANLAVVVLAPMLAKLRTCFDAFFRRQLHGRTDVFIEDAEFCHQLVVRSVDDIPFILRRRPHGSGIAGGCSGHTQPELNATACVAAARRHGILEVGRHGFSKPRGGNVSTPDYRTWPNHTSAGDGRRGCGRCVGRGWREWMRTCAWRFEWQG